MFGGTKSPSPASSNYDFSLRHERVKLFARVLKQFDANVTRTVQAMREVAGSLSQVGQSYHEVAQCVNNTNPTSAMNRPYQVSNINNSNRVVQNYGAHLQGAATMFAGEMKSLREGEQYVAFNGDVHQSVLTRLHEVITRAKKATQLGDDVAVALRKFVAAKKIVQKKEAKYTRLSKPLTESKRYTKQSEEMHAKEQNYETKLRAFDTEYEALMQRQLYVAGHTMDDFLDANTAYLAQILKVLSCLAPHGADTVEKMVDASEELGHRLGVAPEELVGSRLRARNVNTAVSSPATAGGGHTPPPCSAVVTPVKSTPGRTSGGSSHNFTSYYRNRKHRGASADQAPPTARANDDTGTELTVTNCWSVPDSPQRDRVSSHSPQGRYAGLSEPDPTPPPPPPPCANPMARFVAQNTTPTLAGGVEDTPHAPPALKSPTASGATSKPVVQPAHATKTTTAATTAVVVKKPVRTTTVATPSAPAPPPAAAARPSPPPAAAAVAIAHPSIRERSVTLSPGRAPFGDGNTPAFQSGGQRPPSPPADLPQTAISDGRGSPSVKGSPGSPNARQAALESQAALLGLDRARSTEPFDDNCPKGVVSYSSRCRLQPVNLLAAMDAEADSPSKTRRRQSGTQPQLQPARHVNPLARTSGGGGGGGMAGGTSSATAAAAAAAVAVQPLRQPRKSGKKSKMTSMNVTPRTSTGTTAAPANFPGFAGPVMATAPPPDDATLSSSVNSQFLGESRGSLFFQGSVSLTQTSHHAPQPLMLTTPAGLKSFTNAEAWETETGGVSGRSHAMSTSYALDSPAFAGAGREVDVQDWDGEDSQRHRCSAA